MRTFDRSWLVAPSARLASTSTPSFDRAPNGFTICLTLAVLVTVIWTVPARGQTPPDPDCFTQVGYNVEVEQRDLGGADLKYNGVRGDSLQGVDYYCLRVASVSIFRRAGRLVEFGWGLGYICSASAYWTTPKVFMVAVDDTIGLNHCVDGLENGVGNTYKNYRVSDLNEDTIFGGFFGGVLLYTEDVTFAKGDAITNGERDNPLDSAHSHFKVLQTVASKNGSFVNWNNPQLFVDSDPDFRCNIFTNTDHAVEEVPGNTCV